MAARSSAYGSMTVKTSVQGLVAAAGRRRMLQRAIVRVAVTLNDARLIQPHSTQTTIRLADSFTRNLRVTRRVRFGTASNTLLLDLPVRYPAALRLAFEDVYRHPSEGLSLRIFGALARTARCVADVGAHVGVYTYVAAACASRAATIYAFEPLPDLCQTIERNIQRNRLANVRAVASAVGSAAGRAELCIPTDTHYATLEQDWLTLHRIDEFTRLSVDVVALDEYFATQAAVPDLLKIDVEGREEDVLNGMRRIVESSHPEMIIELIGAERGREIIRWLTTDWDYRVFFIGDQLEELAAGDAPPPGELHNFLITRRTVDELRDLFHLPVAGRAAAPAR